MTFVDLLFLPPLILAVSVVVGAAGRARGEIASAVRNTFIALLLGVATVGLVVRALVLLFA